MYENLKKYGWNNRFEQEAAEYAGLFPARVSEQHRDLYKVIGEHGELSAAVSGKLSRGAGDVSSFPAVGDWVMVDRADDASGNAVIHRILRRSAIFTRKAAGTANAVQVIAANIDMVFICMSLNADFNLRRIERYLTIAWDSGAVPVVVLTKADLCEDIEEKMEEVASVSPGVDVIVCSSQDETGYSALRDRIEPGKTVAFIGSSGVGKSTIVNRLMGREVLATQTLRDDDKGRHTTTHRQLLLLPGGGIVIDTPGMRELQIYAGSLSKTFEDVEEIAALCKYRDCTHGTEPGCMVRKAIEDGTLSEKRFESYQKLQRELSYDGLNSRQMENEKINRMFGGKGKMKDFRKEVKSKNRRYGN